MAARDSSVEDTTHLAASCSPTPYLVASADTVVGARRLRRGVRGCTILALLGSIAGTLLAYYLAFRGDFALMRPLTLLEFQLLWVIPVLLLSDWTGRY